MINLQIILPKLSQFYFHLSAFIPVFNQKQLQKSLLHQRKERQAGRNGRSKAMRVKECFCPSSQEQALALLAELGDALQICAGGTDLLVMLRKGKTEAPFLMDISGLDLSGIREEEDHISIGALATLTDVQESPLLNKEPYRFLQRAAGWVGSPQIRNAATLAGNLCTGIPSADTSTPLLALDARVRLASVRRTREIPLTGFFLAPRKTALEADEMVTEVLLPRFPSGDYRTEFRKVGTRKELFISIFHIASLLEMEGPLVKRARFAMGVMAPVPVRLFRTEELLTGKSLTPALIDEALETMKTEVHPRTSRHASKEYRMMLAENLLHRFLTEPPEGAEEGNLC